MAEPSYKANNMAILNGKGRTWIYRDGTWVDDSQTWLNLGKTNSPVATAANAEVDLGAWGGTSKYVYVLWHKNGTYRPNAARYTVRDYLKSSIWNVVTDQQKHRQRQRLRQRYVLRLETAREQEDQHHA